MTLDRVYVLSSFQQSGLSWDSPSELPFAGVVPTLLGLIKETFEKQHLA